MRTRTWLWIAAAGALLWQSGSAAAQECESDADCVKGYACEVVGESGCGFACPDDGKECVPPPDSECEVMQYKACVPGPCSSDADCEDGMVCHEFEAFDCPAVDSGGAAECPPGSECPKPEPAPAPEPCEPSTTTQCVPRYAVPCEEDADCGDGFNCVEDIAYSCAGSAPSMGDPGSSGGSDPGAGDDPAPAPEPRPAPEEVSCTEEPLGTFHCEAREVACEADADCPSEWSCQENYSRPVCGGASSDPGVSTPPSATCPDEMTAIARICDDGSTGKPVCVDGAWQHLCPEDEAADDEPAPAPEEVPAPDDCGIDDTAPERVCAPPFHDLGWGGFGIATSADGAAESGGDRGSLSGPGVPNEEPRPDDGATAGGDEDQNISMGSGETGMDPEADSGGGCAVSAAGTPSGASTGVLALLGASLLGLRRRRRS